MSDQLRVAELPPSDVILSVRSARKLADIGRGLRSGIHKEPHTGRVTLCDTGVPGDSIDYPYHGGRDKALHQYCAAHYPKWRVEKPEIAHMFNIGAFGENISLEALNEHNVCIGDVFRIGADTLVQVTEPRLPCFKVNARFNWPAAARRLQKTDRYGWYVRVLETGSIGEGDTMVLESRPNPRWNVKTCFHVCIDKEVDLTLVQELAGLQGLGTEIRELAKVKLAGGGEDTLSRQHGGAFYFTPFEVTDAQMVAPRVRQIVLEYRGPKDRLITDDLPLHAYMNVRFAGYERPYSVVSGDKDRFVLGVALDEKSRGGSKHLHEKLKVGDRVEVSKGESADAEVPPGHDARTIKHIFIVGGIGITAFLREIQVLTEQQIALHVHYACRSKAEAAFQDMLPSETTTYYAKDKGRRLSIRDIVPEAGKAKVYCCGPERLNEEVKSRCQELGYPAYLQMLESFDVPQPGDRVLGEEFKALVHDPESSKSPANVSIPPTKTLLAVLEDAGFDVPSSCETGRCGICMVSVKCGQQHVKHKGTGLTEVMKARNMLTCVSRARGNIEILIE